MVREIFVERKLEDTKTLLHYMEAQGVKVYACLWFYYSDNERWRLIICTDKFTQEKTLKEHYGFIIKMVEGSGITSFHADSIEVTYTDDEIVDQMSAHLSVKTGEEKYITTTMYDTVFVEEAVVLKMEKVT